MSSSSFPAPPPLTGENYQLWSVKMKAYLKAFDLWDAEEKSQDPPPLPNDPSLAQIKNHREEKSRKFRALTCIHSAVSETIFTRIMTCETAKEAWDEIKEEFEGTEKTKQMKLLTLKREYENLKMKETESIKDYTSRLMEACFHGVSRKQEVVAQSTAEAENVAAAAATNQAIWLRKILKDLGIEQHEATEIRCNNKSTISIAENPVHHGKTKHINVKFHSIREAEKNKEVKLVYCSSEVQIADILTKALPKARFHKLRSMLGVSSKNSKKEC
ncbi:hypothetical protein GH714_019544 [Hevea brasiliensis]|uniref:Uncharacterized protein n=1 Tax=Hevea brasiliensis TaxID=3981 RepID=A0A6A6M2R2_HEVBR|nr:hypothetical protein GH714_019544 [Hevea brasiliensis]